jgi:hypothetical protein
LYWLAAFVTKEGIDHIQIRELIHVLAMRAGHAQNVPNAISQRNRGFQFWLNLGTEDRLAAVIAELAHYITRHLVISSAVSTMNNAVFQ